MEWTRVHSMRVIGSVPGGYYYTDKGPMNPSAQRACWLWHKDSLIVAENDLDFTEWHFAGLLLEAMGRQGDKTWERFFCALFIRQVVPEDEWNIRAVSVDFRFLFRDLTRIRAAALEAVKDGGGRLRNGLDR